MTPTKPSMARAAGLLVLLAQLPPALASFWTVTSYYALSMSTSKLIDSCTTSCRMYTYTSTLTVVPTATPTAAPVSSRTYTNTYNDYEVVRVYVPASAVDQSDIMTTTPTRTSNVFTNYAVPVTWTAPSSCPTPFTVVTATDVYLPYDVTPYVSGLSTTTYVTTFTRTPQTVTQITVFLDQTAVPTSVIGPSTDNFYYSYYVRSCRNPTATGSAYYGPTYTGPSTVSGDGGDDDDDYDWTVCSAMTGCVALATWIIVVATILPAIFLFGFVESYFWFRRMMLGKSALRLGTVCWCALSLWFILLTRRSPTRSPQDQALLRQYWATLSAGTRLRLWFKWGFRWQYPVELLGNPDGNNPVVVQAVPPPGQGPPPPLPQQQQFPPPGHPDQPMYAPGAPPPGDGSEKAQPTVQMQPVYMPYGYPAQPPYPGQPQQPYMMQQPPAQVPGGQPYPGAPQPPPPGSFAPFPQQQQQQQGYAMPMPMPMPQQAAYANGQQALPAYAPSPSPVHTTTTTSGGGGTGTGTGTEATVTVGHSTPPPPLGQDHGQPPPPR